MTLGVKKSIVALGAHWARVTIIADDVSWKASRLTPQRNVDLFLSPKVRKA